MAITKEHIRFSIHFAFHLKKNAAEATAMICAAYRENAVSHTTYKRWYQKFHQGDFSLKVQFLNEPRAGRPQKIETDELQALLDINSAQTEKELAEQLGVTQQTISVRLHTMGKVQKEGRWFRMNCRKTTKIVGVTLHSLCFQSFGKKIFCIKSLQAMKSGFFMITLNVENHELTLVNLRHRRQSPISTPRRFCSVSGGIGKVCCITSCYN
ncbi:hypothetical protein P5V15_007082 [Pogonomyrmex californicus]